MKVGHIAYSYKPIIGGAEVYIDVLKNILDKNGYSQHIYQKSGKSIEDDIINIPSPKVPFLSRKPLYSFNIFLNLKYKFLKKEDIIIIHDPFHFWPIFWHSHSIVLSHGIRWDRKPTSIYNKIHLASAKFTLKYAKKIVANDSLFYRSLGFNLKPMEKMFSEIYPNYWFIPNCVDINFFYKRKGIESIKEKKVIIVPRNITRGRGITLAIQAFDKFKLKYPNTILMVIGAFVDKKYEKEVIQLIHDLKLEDSIKFLGSVPNWIMPEIYSSGIMSIIPTLYEEGTSLAALESMACGTPVVSTSAGGLLDLPCIHSEINPESLADKMCECMNNLKKYAIEQEREVKNTYNMTNFTDAWLKVVESKIK